MNKILLIIVIATGIIAGLLVSYMLKIPVAVAIIDMVKTKIGTLNIGGLNIGSITSIASVIGLAGTAYGLYSQNKAKVAAQVENAKQLVANRQTYEELTDVTNLKTSLEDKVENLTVIKDEAIQTLDVKKQELQESVDTVTSLKKEVIDKDTKLDTLYETVRSLKLDKGEVIVKTEVK